MPEMNERELSPPERLKETLRRNAEKLKDVPEWVLEAVSVDAVFGGSVPTRSSRSDGPVDPEPTVREPRAEQ